MAPNQIFIRLLDGRTQCLQIPSPTISGGTLKRHLFLRTGIPPSAQRLISSLHEVCDETVISASEGGAFPSCTLLLRLRGGKGGFGSLLRGAATKAGQKKTNNFDACRDMSGRRLRHVNAEKRLEEWKAEAEDRRLEKVADQFLRKKTKEVKKGSSVKLERYIEKYKEDSARCMEKMEESVRQSFALYEKSKRKILPSSGPASKRLKIWLGKKKMNESESDNEDDSDDDVGESVVLDDGSQNEGDGGLGSTSGSQSDPESSSGGSGQSNLEEANDVADGRCPNVVEDSRNEIASSDSDGSADPMKERCEEVACVERDALSFEARKECNEVCPEIRNAKDNFETNGQNNMEDKSLPHPSESLNVMEVKLTVDGETRDGAVTHKDSVQSSEDPIMEEPFNFEEFNSSEEMENLGMERLKKELQARGLKCGGTLQERAARLFLLKTIPIDKLPKKLLAKPLPAGK